MNRERTLEELLDQADAWDRLNTQAGTHNSVQAQLPRDLAQELKRVNDQRLQLGATVFEITTHCRVGELQDILKARFPALSARATIRSAIVDVAQKLEDTVSWRWENADWYLVTAAAAELINRELRNSGEVDAGTIASTAFANA